MSENKVGISKKGLIINLAIFAVILLVGLILLMTGFNEAFFSTSSTMRSIFKYITYLGEPIVFIVIIAILFIVYDKKYAKNLLLVLLLVSYVNEFLKNLFKDPRPGSNVDADEITVDNPGGLVETSYGFPSGHTSSAVGTWGYIAYEFKDKPKPLVVPIIMAVIMFLVSISRMIIGVHDLQDVVGGYFFGFVLLLLFIYLEPPITEKFNALSMNVKIILIVVISIALFLLGALLFPYSGTVLLPDPPALTDTGNFAMVGGAILGFGIGYLLENEKIQYEPSKLSGKQKVIALIIGLAIVFIVYFALEALKGVFDSAFYRFIRYALVAFITVYFLPLIYTKMWKN
ncbi:MAG: phosphatase PAP2 family protein [Candidatus Lokiarchaeota archaeon]|nr:phosphatase PAP2 family protein [Candidatus Lokiarchaeota archaeon]